MISRLLPASWIRLLRDRITGFIHPASLLKYRPHAREGSSYVVLRKQAPAAGSSRGPEDLPLPPVSMRLGYSADDQVYLDDGRRTVETMSQLLGKAGRDLGHLDRILDFGCGTGRLIRWLRPHAERAEIWGLDVAAHYIEWCQENLGDPFHFAMTTTLPHLPFEDHSFDLVYAGSVFTHLDDLADSWLLEIRRILRPGGTLYVTLHDENTIRLLESKYRDWPLSRWLSDEQFLRYRAQDYGMISMGTRTTPQVFYESGYFKQRACRLFHLESYTPEAYFYQSAAVLTKPVARAAGKAVAE